MLDKTAALRWPLLLVVAIIALEARAQQTFVEVDLNAAEWEISNQNGSINVSSVQLPVMALQALYEAGMLSAGDPINRYGYRTDMRNATVKSGLQAGITTWNDTRRRKERKRIAWQSERETCMLPRMTLKFLKRVVLYYNLYSAPLSAC